MSKDFKLKVVKFEEEFNKKENLNETLNELNKALNGEYYDQDYKSVYDSFVEFDKQMKMETQDENNLEEVLKYSYIKFNTGRSPKEQAKDIANIKKISQKKMNDKDLKKIKTRRQEKNGKKFKKIEEKKKAEEEAEKTLHVDEE
jgi:hypothetical protein